MASRYSAGLLTSAGSTTLPIAALVGASTIRPRIWEIGVFNTTATAVALHLVRMTTAGTPAPPRPHRDPRPGRLRPRRRGPRHLHQHRADDH